MSGITRRQSRFQSLPPIISSDEPDSSISPQKANKALSSATRSPPAKKPRGVVKKLKQSSKDETKKTWTSHGLTSEIKQSKHQSESPWNTYTFIDEITKDSEKVIKVRKLVSGKIFAFRVFANDEKSRVIERQFKILNHHNVLPAEEYLRNEQNVFVRSPVVDVSFGRIVLCRQYPSSGVLASMMGQTMDGLEYLVGHGVICDSITCSKILVTEEGCIKIVAFSDAKIQDQLRASTINLSRRLASIMILLMQKFENEVGEKGIQDRIRWPPQDEACEFLQCLQNARCLDSGVYKHHFITPKARDGEGLIDLVVKTLDTTLDLHVRLSQDEQSHLV